MIRRRLPALRDEQGMTMIEVVVATLVMALIAAPLAFSVFLAITTIPKSGSRTERAAERFFLTDKFARDTANAVSISVPDEDPPSGEPTETQCPPAAPATTTVPFYEATWHDGGTVTVTYTANFVAPVGSVWRVDITRTENAGAPRLVATGYCNATSGIVPISVSNHLETGDLHRRVHATLKLMPRPDQPVEVTDLEGALGKTR